MTKENPPIQWRFCGVWQRHRGEEARGRSLVKPLLLAILMALVAQGATGQEQALDDTPRERPPQEDSSDQPSPEQQPAFRSMETPDDYPNRRDILHPDGTPRDLSHLSKGERQRVVREYYTDEKEALKRATRRKLKLGWISQDHHDALLGVPGTRYCWFGPEFAPNGVTRSRLRELEAEMAGRTTTELWYRIMDEPPVGDEPGVRVQVPSPDGPNCAEPIDEWED